MRPIHARLSRRRFLKSTATGLLAAPLVVHARLLGLRGADSPSERLRTAHIGLGGRGRENLRKLEANAVALCDVDSSHLAEARKALPPEREVFLAADYRKLLDRKDVDAVVISTPDHWHALPAIHACQAGKHVYCEKPLTLTIIEGRAMVKAARAARVAVQTGSQQRSAAEFRRACEIVRSGLVGDVKEVLVGIPGVNYKGPPVPDAAPPPELDYDFWLGPAPARPYNEKRVHYQFRFFWDYSGGQQTNFGAHHIDIAQWGLGRDESGPVEVEGTARYHEKDWFEVPESYELTYKYADGVVLRVGTSLPQGVTFAGARGRVHVERGKIESDPADLVRAADGELKVRLPETRGHHEDWLDAVRAGRAPICDVEIGHRSATACHLGNIALRLRRKIRWDPSKEEVLGDPEAQAMTRRTYRKPWVLPA